VNGGKIGSNGNGKVGGRKVVDERRLIFLGYQTI